MASYQHEVQDLQSELHAVTDAPERTNLKETRQKGQTDLEGKPDDTPAGRRTERARNPTEKMRVLQMEEAKKKEKSHTWQGVSSGLSLKILRKLRKT